MDFIIIFKFFIKYPLNAYTQGGLISLPCPWYITDGQNFFYCRWQSTQFKVPWAKENSKGKYSFRQGLIQGAQTVSSELLPIIPICFLLSWLPFQEGCPFLVARWQTVTLAICMPCTSSLRPKHHNITLTMSYIHPWINHGGQGNVIL